MAGKPPFDPYAILAALERRRVTYVVIGAFARVVQGAEEITHFGGWRAYLAQRA